MPSVKWHYFLFHEEGQSHYLYKFEDNEWMWFHSNSFSLIELDKQTKTLRINKSNYSCDEGNSNRFMQCMESYFSKQLGCILSWTMNDNNQENNNGLNLCKGKEKFKEFRKITRNILKPGGMKEFFKEDCSLPRLVWLQFWSRRQLNWYNLYFYP